MFNVSMFACVRVFDDVTKIMEHVGSHLAGRHGCKKKKMNRVWGMGRERKGGKKTKSVYIWKYNSGQVNFQKLI